MLWGKEGGEGLCDRLVGHRPLTIRGGHCVICKMKQTVSEHQVCLVS